MSRPESFEKLCSRPEQPARVENPAPGPVRKAGIRYGGGAGGPSGKGFIHVQGVRGRLLHQAVAMPEERADVPDRFGRAKRGAQPHGVQVLEPLAVLPVALPAAGVLDVAGVSRQASNPRVSRIWYRGIQYTPVASIATTVTPHWRSQSRHSWCLNLPHPRLPPDHKPERLCHQRAGSVRHYPSRD